jgi:hypothetical protein
MFYSMPLTMAADAKLFELGVCQLAAPIPFEGVVWRSATLYKHFDTDEICCYEAANLCK